jgi:hypothetical protein
MAGATVVGGSKVMANSSYEGPNHVYITAVVENNNGGSFQWYFSDAHNFSGIFLKMTSFNGMNLIFPFDFTSA